MIDTKLDAEAAADVALPDQKDLDSYADELVKGKVAKDLQAQDLIDSVTLTTKDAPFDPIDYSTHVAIVDDIMTEVASPKMDPEVVSFLKGDGPGLIAAAEAAQARADEETDPERKAELQAHANAHAQVRLAVMAGLVAAANEKG